MSKLAINGGEKAIPNRLPTILDSSGRSIGKEELRHLQEVIEAGSLSFLSGRKTAELEDAFKKLYGRNEAVAVSSGTAALHTAVIALNPEPGDEIILSPITDIGTAIPVISQLAVPVFADIDPATQNISPISVESLIGERTRAIIVTHIYGNPADMDAIMRIARKHDLIVIEDCAQALLATYKDKLCGTIGHIGCFSFQQSKHMTTGDGGMVIADSKELRGRDIRLCSDKGWPRSEGGRNHLFLAPNYHMTELQAAVGLAQLSKLEHMVAARTASGNHFLEMLDGLAVDPVWSMPETHGTYFFACFRLRPDYLTVSTVEVVKALQAEGVDGFLGYPGPKPLYRYPVIQDHKTFGSSGWPFTLSNLARNWDYSQPLCPEAEKACVETVCLWWNEKLTHTHLSQISDAIQKVLSAFKKE